jgi:hypothetical protein
VRAVDVDDVVRARRSVCLRYRSADNARLATGRKRARSTLSPVSADRKLVTAAELDAMSPDERAALVSDRIVTDLDELSPELRDRVLATGRRLALERSQDT